MDADRDTFVTALYVKIDDELATNPSLRVWRPEVGIVPKLSDAQLLTMAVLQALLGFSSETRFLRHAKKHLSPCSLTSLAGLATTSGSGRLNPSSKP